jgi:hypothetical protein
MANETDIQPAHFLSQIPEHVWHTAAERLSQVARSYGASTRNRVAAAQTLGITLTCIPFEDRAAVLQIALALVGITPADDDQVYNSGSPDLPSPVRPREAFLQLQERERTYLSNIPAHTPMARISRLLIRRGILHNIAPDLDPVDLRRRILAIKSDERA